MKYHFVGRFEVIGNSEEVIDRLFFCLRFGRAKTSLVLSAQTSLRGSATSLLREQKLHCAQRCISRSIPPRADMLHIENPDRDLYRRAEGASPHAPVAHIAHTPCAYHEAYHLRCVCFISRAPFAHISRRAKRGISPHLLPQKGSKQ